MTLSKALAVTAVAELRKERSDTELSSSPREEGRFGASPVLESVVYEDATAAMCNGCIAKVKLDQL